MDNDKLRSHSYDGIQEYDNDLPRWWVWLFVLTIVFSVIYPFIYDFGPGTFASETIDSEISAIRSEQAKREAGSGMDDSTLLALAGQGDIVKAGKEIYASKCMVCHGDQGQGLVGPNLTDDYWVHGGRISEVRKVIMNGVLEKGMLAWKDQLPPDQINAVVAFVWSLRGSSPPNPKAPQGELVRRE